jgi:hypothetical protein
MFRKHIISFVVCVALLLTVSTLAVAQSEGQVLNQTAMGTATPMVEPLSTLLSDLPLSGAQTGMGTCPMMNGTGMTGSMSGMNMNGMGSMSGMSGMSGMQGMSGMNMVGMDGMTMNISTPWYSNPWWVLGWVILTLIIIAILAGIVLSGIWLLRRPRPAALPETS